MLKQKPSELANIRFFFFFSQHVVCQYFFIINLFYTSAHLRSTAFPFCHNIASHHAATQRIQQLIHCSCLD